VFSTEDMFCMIEQTLTHSVKARKKCAFEQDRYAGFSYSYFVRFFVELLLLPTLVSMVYELYLHTNKPQFFFLYGSQHIRSSMIEALVNN